MNYRHAFHAGNFADVFKHNILARILTHLREKTAPFRVIDTHAGEGLYDLAGEEATRTGEWRDGIGRLFGVKLPADAAALMATYFSVLRACNGAGEWRYYPGSPVLARHLLRPQDRLVACELEPRAAAVLSRQLRACPAAKVVRIDGWIALNAYVPAKERRGLVIVDPAFEQPNDLTRLANGVAAAYRKWPTGIYVLWYPIKGHDETDRVIKTLQRAAIEKYLRAEFAVASPQRAGVLNACGVIVVNPPWRLGAEIRTFAPPLLNALARDSGAGYALDDLGAPIRLASC
jgi:23S rRNA (adenine2030-N6)-methyltransferase